MWNSPSRILYLFIFFFTNVYTTKILKTDHIGIERERERDFNLIVHSIAGTINGIINTLINTYLKL